MMATCETCGKQAGEWWLKLSERVGRWLRVCKPCLKEA